MLNKCWRVARRVDVAHCIRVRAAETADVEDMCRIVSFHAERGVILPRSCDDIFEHLQEFVVALCDDRVAGTAAMHIYGSNLAEVRSLAVDNEYRGQGLGRLLVEACERWAAGLGVACVFALTYVPEFFVRMGFERVDKESLPQKIWTVCVHCEKFSRCDEVAVRKRLSDAPIEPMRLTPIVER